MSEKKQSKYLRDGNEKKSKYIRDKNEKAYSSKYVRTDEQKEAFKEYQKNKKNEKQMSAKTRYEMYLERERLRNIEIEGEIFDDEEILAAETPVEEAVPEVEEAAVEVEAAEEEAPEREYIRAKGTSTDIFKTREANIVDEMNYRQAEKQTENKLEKAIFVRLGWTAVLALLAIVLQFPAFRFHIPFTPKFLTIDFSLFPSAFAAIAYGPITGVAISLVKNIIFVALDTKAIGTAASNVILDTVFLVILSVMYTRGMFSKKAYQKKLKQLKETGKLKDNRRSRIFVSGLVASIVTALVSIVTVNFIMYPILFKVYSQYGFTAEYLLPQYESAIQGVNRLLPFTKIIVTKIGSLERGVFFFNAPVSFTKLMGVTIVTTILYKPLSRLLHYRPKQDKKK